MGNDLEKAIVSYLDKHRHMVLATVEDDVSPYASTVSYVNKGLTIYFMTDPSSQKGGTARSPQGRRGRERGLPRTGARLRRSVNRER